MNSSSPEASDQLNKCVCDPGFTGPDGGLCQLCVPGTFKVNLGSIPCTNCLANQYSTTLGAISNPCQPCLSNSASLPASDAQADCICNARSSGPNGGSCTLCEAGKYKIEPGEAACTMCAGGTYSTSVDAVENVCLGCPDRPHSLEGNDENIDYTCNLGASGPNGGCQSRLGLTSQRCTCSLFACLSPLAQRSLLGSLDTHWMWRQRVCHALLALSNLSQEHSCVHSVCQVQCRQL